MRRALAVGAALALLVCAAPAIGGWIVAPAQASTHQGHHAGPRITLLFSVKAQKHPRMPGYTPPGFTCSVTDGGAYRICCSWNDREGEFLGKEPDGTPLFMGAWDCTGVAVQPLAR